MPRHRDEPIVPGSPEEDGGAFVLIDDVADHCGTDATAALAQGSDVLDVEELDRQLMAASIDDLLRAYLNDERDVPRLPPLPPRTRRPR